MKIQQDRSTKRPSELVKQNPPNHYAALQPRVGAVDLHTPAQPTCTPSLKETARHAGKCPTTPPHPSLRSPEDLPLPSWGALCVNPRRACARGCFGSARAAPARLSIFTPDPCMRVCCGAAALLCDALYSREKKGPRHAQFTRASKWCSAISAPPVRLGLLRNKRRRRRVSCR
jgi:hypothetical protein